MVFCSKGCAEGGGIGVRSSVFTACRSAGGIGLRSSGFSAYRSGGVGLRSGLVFPHVGLVVTSVCARSCL